jgi:hypothetical protein
MTYPYKSFGQDMLAKPAKELDTLHGHFFLFVVPVVEITKPYILIVN